MRGIDARIENGNADARAVKRISRSYGAGGAGRFLLPVPLVTVCVVCVVCVRTASAPVVAVRWPSELAARSSET
jgi:hypothetical protein